MKKIIGILILLCVLSSVSVITYKVRTVTVQYDVQKIKPYAERINKFSCNLFSKMSETSENNTFISPISIYTVMAMLTNGAKGSTAAELTELLGVNDIKELNRVLKGYLKGCQDDDVMICSANSVWIGNKLEKSADIDRLFVKPVKEFYDAQVYENVDFESQNTVDKANKWAYDKTNKTIDKVIELFPKDIVFMLMNAIYFNGKWTEPFDEEFTNDEYFDGTSNRKLVKMMHNGGSYKYYSDDYFNGLEMEYGDGDYVMDLLMLSDDKKSTGDVWKSMTNDEQAAAVNAFSTKADHREISEIQLPKIKIEYCNNNLKEVLKSMGVTKAFEDSAEFGNIGNMVKIDEIIHKSILNVDEESTEAAAVTLGLEDGAAPISDVGITYIVDRPFILFIRDTKSGIILFAGEINNID